MTTPDRTDGDGLLPCPICQVAGAKVLPRGELYAVSCENDDCPFTVEIYGVDERDAVRNWNTRDQSAAPPKPAPDALREAFEAWAISDHRGVQPLEGEERTDSNNHYYDSDEDNAAFIGWKAALAAPVQSGGETIPAGFCSPGGKASCLHLHWRERCSNCPVNEQIANKARARFAIGRILKENLVASVDATGLPIISGINTATTAILGLYTNPGCNDPPEA